MSNAPDRARLEALQRTPMTSWYDPFQLARSVVDIAVSGLLGTRSDIRLIQALAKPQPAFDFAVRGGAPRDELWIDYVADTGDGFNPTYAIASLLGRPALALEGHETKRGDVLVMGGDQVYPSPTREAYWTRLVEPYTAALPEADMADRKELPRLFAIPGNHDWYDGLTTFMRLFCQQRTLGAWKTLQTRSYFALKLPHGFWLLGVDIQLEADIDQPQIDYFCHLARDEMRDGDRIILCTAEPDWVKGVMLDPVLQANLAFFENKLAESRPGVEVVARIAGDLHHYRHHESEDGRHNFIAGGGGAFLHPTHGERVDTVHSGSGARRRAYSLKTSFPSESASWRLTWWNLLFAGFNPGSWPVAGVIYMISSLMLLSPDPSAIAWGLVILLVCIAFSDKKRPRFRWLAGPLHGLAHLAAAFELTLLACDMIGLDWMEAGSMMEVLGVSVFVGLSGALIGPTILGIYLLISLLVMGRHGNEAFSAIKIQDYKHFLRIHVHPAGLTVYPIALRRVPRAWRYVEDRRPGEPYLAPARGELTPELIEPPITIPIAARAAAPAREVA